MRTRRCNACKTYSPVLEWDYGCPACGYSNITGEIVRVSEFPGVEVMPDIKPYKNMLDGKEISSRSKHRQLLRQHGCIEIGNETKYLLEPRARPDVDPQHRQEIIIAQVQAMGGHDRLRQAVKREVEHIRWNSRKD